MRHFYYAPLLLALILTGCTAPANLTTAAVPFSTSQPAQNQQTYNNPFAYCAAVGTLDAPDARYTGEPLPTVIIDGYKTAAGLASSSEPLEMLEKTTFWRCMDGKVYACNVGANLPCTSKANLDKTPTSGMADFCKANPGSDFIPMSVTGHETVYSWHCTKDVPEVLAQVSQVDAAGYIADIWYPIAEP